MELISNIYRIIEEKGLRKGYIANKMNVSLNQLRNWDRCISYPTTPKLFELAKILAVKTDDLYEEANNEKRF